MNDGSAEVMAGSSVSVAMTGTQPFRFDRFDPAEVAHGIAGRHGGVSDAPFTSLNLSVKTEDKRERVGENRRRFERLMGFETRQAAFGRLSHGCAVTVFQLGGLLPPMAPPDLGWPMFDSDAAISNVPGLFLLMTFADCVPVLLWDRENRACALIHAGWRGTALRIASTTVEAMKDSFGTNPIRIEAGIGPSIGPECYPVGESVRDEFVNAYGQKAEDFFAEAQLDLWQANRFDLESVGVRTDNIDIAGICTACHRDEYFSHRADSGSTGRFGACIGIRYPGRFGMRPAAPSPA